jgi:hypothetical protein
MAGLSAVQAARLRVVEQRDLLRTLAAEGVAVLVSSHVLSELDEMADRWSWWTRAGRSARTGSPTCRGAPDALAVNEDSWARSAVRMFGSVLLFTWVLVHASHVTRPGFGSSRVWIWMIVSQIRVLSLRVIMGCRETDAMPSACGTSWRTCDTLEVTVRRL